MIVEIGRRPSSEAVSVEPFLLGSAWTEPGARAAPDDFAAHRQQQHPASLTERRPAKRALHELISVYDGDTIRIGDERIRIVGLDTPELGHRARCRQEAHAAERAKQALQREIARGNVALIRQGTDRYGRTLAQLTVHGRDVADTMIARGHARPNNGEWRSGWCD